VVDVLVVEHHHHQRRHHRRRRLEQCQLTGPDALEHDKRELVVCAVHERQGRPLKEGGHSDGAKPRADGAVGRPVEASGEEEFDELG